MTKTIDAYATKTNARREAGHSTVFEGEGPYFFGGSAGAAGAAGGATV